MENISFEDKEFYKDELSNLLLAEKIVLDRIEEYRKSIYKINNGIDPIEHCKSRIKSAKSMKNKLKKRNLPINLDSALNILNDAVGVRIICKFIDDVYNVYKWIENDDFFTVINVKDYIKNPKSNGYRSLHIIVAVNINDNRVINVEIQIRTIALDCWASLEHQMKYKKNIENQKLIEKELKRCADEIASTDLSMQTLRELILENAMIVL